MRSRCGTGLALLFNLHAMRKYLFGAILLAMVFSTTSPYASADIFTPSGNIEAPIFLQSNEWLGGQMYNLSFYNNLDFVNQVKTVSYSCLVSSGICSTSFSFDYLTNRYTALVNVTGYAQGEKLRATIIRKWGSPLTQATGFIQTTVKLDTLKPSPRPIRGPVSSDIGGCSFRILNYDADFTYYFKHTKIAIGREGKVRIMLNLPGASEQDYISITRPGYTTLNATETLFTCIGLR